MPGAVVRWYHPPDPTPFRVMRSVSHVPPVQQSLFRDLLVSPDGSTLVVTMGETMSLREVAAGEEGSVRMLNFRSQHHTAAFGRTGRFLFTSSKDGEISLVDWRALKVLRTVVTGCAPRKVAFSEAKMAAVIATSAGGILLYQLDDRPWLRRLEAVNDTKACVDVSVNGDIAWGDERGNVRVLVGGSEADAVTFKVCGASEGAVNSLRFSPDGSRMVTAGMDGAVREWTRDGRLLRTLAEGQVRAWSAVYAQDGSVVAAGFNDGVVRIWREDRAEPIVASFPAMRRIPSVAFSPDGSRLAAATTGSQPIVLDASTGEVVGTLQGHTEEVRVVTWSPDGRTIATGCDDRQIRFWNAETFVCERAVAGLPWGPFQLRYHPGGAVLFAIGRGGQLLVLDPKHATELARFPVIEGVAFDLSITADGRRLLVSGPGPGVGVIEFDRLAAPIRANEGWWRATAAAPHDRRPVSKERDSGP